MTEELSSTTDSGQVGIGTLIVFIAMVLVAAIAAGVLIQTSGFLKTKGTETGEESTKQVSNRVSVVDAYGNVTAPDNEVTPLIKGKTIDYVNLSIKRIPGSDTNLTVATIQWIGPRHARALTHVGHDSYPDTMDTLEHGTGVDGSTHFTTLRERGESNYLLLDESARIKIVINATLVTNNAPEVNSDAGFSSSNPAAGLREGESVQLVLTTQYGTQTQYIVSVPESLESKRAVKV